MDSVQQQIDIGAGRRIGYREAGAGPVLLMLHGIGSGSLSFSAELQALSGRYRVIAWDTPGYGGSDDSPLPSPTPADYAADAVALLDALGIERAHLLGHSLGGLISTALVARHAPRVERVVLSSCGGGYAGLDETERNAKLNARIEDMTRLGPAGMAALRAPKMLAAEASEAVRARAIEIMARLRPQGFIQAAHLLGNGDALAEVRAWPPPPPPTLVLVGAEDAITPPPGIRRIAHCIPGSRYVEIAGAGHAAYLEQPEAYCALLREFLDAAGAAP